MANVPKVASLVELNETLEERRREDLGRRVVGHEGSTTGGGTLFVPPAPRAGVRGSTDHAGKRQLPVAGAVRHQPIQPPGEVRPSDDHGGGDRR